MSKARAACSAAREAGVRELVFVSSPSVANSGAAIAGLGAEAADPVRAHGDYSRTKAEAELLALAADSPGFRVAAVRPHIVWGPGDTQLVERVLERASRGRLPLLDAGAALIDTTYMDNAAAAIVAALDRMEHIHGQALVVTNGEPRPVGELLAGICGRGRRPLRRRGRCRAGWPAGCRVGGGEGGAAGPAGPGEPPMTRFLAEQLSTAHWFDQRETREAPQLDPRGRPGRGPGAAGRLLRQGPARTTTAVEGVTERGERQADRDVAGRQRGGRRHRRGRTCWAHTGTSGAGSRWPRSPSC